MKLKQVVLFILFLVVIDQAIKFYIKTNFYYGEEHKVFGLNWFRLHFIENSGMAWGWKLGKGDIAKVALTLFRLIAVIWGSFYIKKIISKNYHKGFIICVAFIYAGALGNLIDSLFYGLIFENSDPDLENIARAFSSNGGYAGLMYGRVVDMWYFPLINTTLPSGLPIWAGKHFEFFQPVFNTADVWVSTGVITLLIFQKRFLKKK
ncbi:MULTISPECIES: lipoprotein signal peptidase [Hydrotalea]|uniref:lipoprotein signal peptidase n=1 Tax=Hydrotalea TaxID=1004300 RepID=UPI000833D775|nr:MULTISPECIES: lipoprotein signal peptidase [Hydrotalea]RTL53349.1 MAG: lipoprotein signal peptidase [Sphingobacteriales bacterium]RWZ84909.1 MAG: lipoprotein signal peptidase [Hydrotalea sp. AMD]